MLTKAEPGLSQSGTAIWRCTYVVENLAQSTAYRGITGVLDGFATFWNVRPA